MEVVASTADERPWLDIKSFMETWDRSAMSLVWYATRYCLDGQP